MFNKIYDKAKKFMKENYKYIIFLVLFACFCFYDTGYSIYKPGGTINASERVSGKNLYKSEGSFNMAYVGMLKGNLPSYLLAKIIPSWELVKNEEMKVENESMDDMLLRDQLYYKEAISNATKVALTTAHQNFEISNTHFKLIYKSKESNNDLKVGDEILSYDNITFTDVSKFIEYINTKKENDIIVIKYKRDKKENSTNSKIYKEKDELYIGLSIIKLYDIKSDHNIEVKSKSSESGPSGGLITTLSIYDSLVEEDITKGYKIVGTGSIDEAGNVGEIGSVTYKLASAVKDDADIFFCPMENYEEALAFSKNKKYNIIIEGVSKLTDALDILDNMEEKNERD